MAGCGLGADVTDWCLDAQRARKRVSDARPAQEETPCAKWRTVPPHGGRRASEASKSDRDSDQAIANEYREPSLRRNAPHNQAQRTHITCGCRHAHVPSTAKAQWPGAASDGEGSKGD